MSTFKCEVVPVALTPHPNADSLSLVEVYGFTCVVRTSDWQGRDRGVYIPVDALVPDAPAFAFLEGHRRIKAKRLRGVFSMGLLIPAPDGAQIGDDLTEALGVSKYDPDLFTDPSTGTEDAPAPPGLAPTYTDIESLRRYKNVLRPGERVIVTEKIHGANMRATVREGALHVGSRTRWKRQDPRSAWWKAAMASRLDARLEGMPDLVIYGEAYGQVQDLRYSAGQGECRFRAFDIFDPTMGRYVDHDNFRTACTMLGIDMAPVLYDGPYDYDRIAALAEEDSVVDGAGGIREGVVVRPAVERWEHMGRVILKLHSQRFLLRKGA